MSLATKFILKTRKPRSKIEALTYKYFADPGPTRKLKDRFVGQPMLIVGNGPSLNETPLDYFEKIPSIGMNKIDLLFPRVQWRPSLIVCTNYLVAKQHRHVFAKSEIPIFLSWKTRLAMPGATKNVSYFLNKAERTFSNNIVEGLGVAGTVTYTALQFAWYMGADPIILVGVDHSFVTTGKQNEIQKREGADQNHFDPNYFASGSYWGVPNLDISEIGYLSAKKAFEESGRKIYDATIGGKLEIFPKISIEEAIAMTQLD